MLICFGHTQLPLLAGGAPHHSPVDHHYAEPLDSGVYTAAELASVDRLNDSNYETYAGTSQSVSAAAPRPTARRPTARLDAAPVQENAYAAPTQAARSLSSGGGAKHIYEYSDPQADV